MPSKSVVFDIMIEIHKTIYEFNINEFSRFDVMILSLDKNLDE